MKTLTSKESAELYQTLVEKANSIIMFWDKNGIIHHINEFGADFFGYKHNEIIGQHVMILVPDMDSRGNDLRMLAQNILDHPEQHIRMPNENITKDDKRVWISWTNKAIQDEYGNVNEILAIGNDITELRRIEDKLRIEHDKLKAILENLNVGVGVTDNNGNTISLNKAALQIHGFKHESEMHHSFLKYVQDFELQYPDGTFMPVADWPSSRAVRGEFVRDYEVRLVRKKNNTERYINYSVTPVFDRYGEVTYFVFNMVDITDRKMMENTLLSKNQDLELVNQKLGKFNDLLENLLYIAAHDLKGPLNNFKMAFDLFDLMKTKEEKLELIERFRSNYIHLEKTIRGLTEILEIQQIDKCHIKTIDVESCLKEILNDINLSKEIDINISWDFKNAPVITYVSAYFTSILKNIISNAVKYRKKGEPLKIHLESWKRRTKMVVSVKDNGIGIDLEKNGKDLFKPFKRFAADVDGTGVGLYLIQNMISENGGRIEVESQPGNGATFNCYFKEYKLD